LKEHKNYAYRIQHDLHECVPIYWQTGMRSRRIDLAKEWLDERTKDIEWAMGRYPDLRFFLDLHKAVMKAQRELRENPKKGTLLDWSHTALVKSVQQETETTGRPMIRSFKHSMINEDEMRETATQIVGVLVQHAIHGSLDVLYEKLISKEFSIGDLLGAVAEADDEKVVNVATSFGVEGRLLIFLAHMLIQPWAEQVASEIDQAFIEKWGRPECPVCGIRPVVEWTIEGKRFLSCTLCGLRFPIDPFLCPFCGNRDPYTLKSLIPDNYPSFRVDYCEKCRHYTKVIVRERLKERIPIGLEDLLTYDLDLIARSENLVRDWTTGVSPTEAQHV